MKQQSARRIAQDQMYNPTEWNRETSTPNIELEPFIVHNEGEKCVGHIDVMKVLELIDKATAQEKARCAEVARKLREFDGDYIAQAIEL